MENFQEKFQEVKEGVRQLQAENEELLNALKLAQHYLLLHFPETDQHMQDIRAIIEGSEQ